MSSSLDALRLSECTIHRHLFIDGGSNTGEGVDAWFNGAMHRCALHSPTRLYGSWWGGASAKAKSSAMAVLASPKSWCVRSFEANPALLPRLREREATSRSAAAYNVHYVDGLLGTVTSDHYPRTVVTYSNDSAGAGATIFAFNEIFFTGKPPNMGERIVRGPSYDVRDVVREALRLQPQGEIAIKLGARALTI